MAAHPSPALSDWTASTTSPMLNDVEKQGFHSPVVTAFAPPPTNQKSGHHPFALHRRNTAQTHLGRVERIQHYNNIFGYVLSLSSIILTAVLEAFMIHVLVKFYTTKDIPAPGRVSPWAKGTELWPAFVLLASSCLTFLIDLGGLCAALCRRWKKASKVEDTFTYIGYGVFIVKWIVVLVLYRIGKTSKDLWGWSCDERAKKIQQYYIGDLDFDKLCVEQTAAWYLTFVEVAVKVILFATALLLTHKVKKWNSRV